jgi:Uma2 family endonuclease
MGPVAQKLMTAEEFWLLPENHRKLALVRGEVVESMPPGGKPGVVALNLAMQLKNWADAGNGGCIGVESGFRLDLDPDTVRAPDVYYVRPGSMPASGIPERFWDQAPDLAVEVVSPSETADELREKVRDYLQAGTAQVWVVYPRRREVMVHTPDGVARTFDESAALEAPELLPGFRCTVAALFA